MAIVPDDHTFGVLGFQTSHSQAHTISENAVVVAYISLESTVTISDVEFGGVAMTELHNVLYNGIRLAAYYLLSSLAAGEHDLTFTTSGVAYSKVYIESVTGHAEEAPEDSGSDTQDSSGDVVGDGFDLTVSDDAYVIAAVINSAASPTLDGVSTVTGEEFNNANGWIMGTGVVLDPGAGSHSVDWDFSSTSTNKVAIALSLKVAAAGGTDPSPQGRTFRRAFRRASRRAA